MNVEAFLNFIMQHNAPIIEVLVGLTLLAILFLAIRSFLYSKDEPTGATGNMAELEASLKKILEKANQVPSVAAASAVAAGGGAVDSTPLLAEITKLKTDLEAKQKKIEELSASAVASAAGGAAPAAGGGVSTEEKDKLETQIKELQAKLSEYEIISEDIADLSFYKEQNARLQKELEEAKGGVATAAAPPPPSAPAPAPVTEVAPPAPVAAPAEPAAPAAAVPEAAPPAAAPAAPATPEAAPAAAAPETPAPEAAPVPVENVVDTNLMAEFEAAVEQQQQEEKKKDLGSMNMDKMMAEAAQIKTDVPDIKAEDVLNQTLDENKLLQEANAMKGENGEDKKLMGQFEDFVKKGES